MPTPPENPSPTGETVSRQSLANRTGYDEDFLGLTVPLPLPARNGVETVILPYTHFSVVFRPDRRLAAATGVTIDGAKLSRPATPSTGTTPWARGTWSAASTPSGGPGGGIPRQVGRLVQPWRMRSVPAILPRWGPSAPSRCRWPTSPRSRSGTGTPFGPTEVRILGGLTVNQRDAFAAVGDDTIDDLLIGAEGVTIDGPSGVLGMAGPTDFRYGTAQFGAMLPAKGIMRFDSDDLARMETDGTLVDVITHEMGHVQGIGNLWKHLGLLTGAGGGGPGTRDSHWREAVFVNELMSPFISGSDNPLSRMTAASLGDLGCQVDLDGAPSRTRSRT